MFSIKREMKDRNLIRFEETVKVYKKASMDAKRETTRAKNVKN